MNELSSNANSQTSAQAESGHQFSLRLLAVLVTLWCVFAALAAPRWPRSLPLLAFAALLSASLFGMGAFLQRHRSVRLSLAAIFALVLTVSLCLPIDAARASSSTVVAEVIPRGLSVPLMFFRGGAPIGFGTAAMVLILVTLPAMCYGTVFAYISLLGVSRPETSRWRKFGYVSVGIAVVCTCVVPLLFFSSNMGRAAFPSLRELNIGYYFWLAGLVGIWLSHMSSKRTGTWALLVITTILLGLAALM